MTKRFRHRPAMFNWFGAERRGVTTALDDVSLTAAAGEVLVLLGPNGSGKTTLLKLVSTMLLPDEGTVTVAGCDTLRHGAQVRQLVSFAVASERSFFPRLTAYENLEFFAALENVRRRERRSRIAEVLETTELAPQANMLAMKFSSGMYQRLGIARALLGKPSVLLLDEPSRSLDPGAAQRLWAWLRATNAGMKTVMLSSHNFAEAVAVGDSVAILRQGQVVAQRKLASVSADELRSFYFREVESAREDEDVLSGEARDL